MKRYRDRDDHRLASSLRAGAIGVLKTDTLYGIVAAAHHEAATKRLYKVRGRSHHKACIVLVAGHEQLFDPHPENAQQLIHKLWPGRVSIILPAGSGAPAWVPQQVGTIAYRVPADAELRRLLRKTGPLLAPSANLAGRPPARSIHEAEKYFKNSVDFYVDSGTVGEGVPPSQLIKVHPDGRIERLR